MIFLQEVDSMQQVKSILSIIVPIYNAQLFIERCVDSILTQDFIDYEIILVDDGSPDGSLGICKALQEKDKRIKVIHQTNSGVNAARFRGFKESAGEYVMFVDADDMLPPTAISSLMTEIQKGYDIVKGEYVVICDNGKIRDIQHDRVLEKEYNGKEFAISLLRGEVSPFLWGSIYKKKLIKDSFFSELTTSNIVVGEDFIMNLFMSKDVNCVKCYSRVVYMYYMNELSVMHKSVTSSLYFDRVYNIIRPLYRNIEYVDLLNKKKLLVYLHNMLVPELGYEQNRYNYAYKELKKRETREYVKNVRGISYILFFDMRFLYRIYTILYRMLFRIIKLKGKKRNVIN